mgnify:CR=1 FL=1
MRAVRPEKIPYMLVQGDEDSEKRQLELPFRTFWLVDIDKPAYML